MARVATLPEASFASWRQSQGKRCSMLSDPKVLDADS
jgi:hypothetical protein